MNRGTAVILLLALVVGASGCIHSQPADSQENADRNPDQAPPSDNTGASDDSGTDNNTVFYTDSGFQPSTLTIEEGETVTWLDRSGSRMWVATDNHPSHTLYDGTHRTQHCQSGESDVFDQCSTGEEYSFTFEKTGEWGYHNHEGPGSGTIIVN